MTAAVPRHIAIIMDGNGRWAKERGSNVSAGHRAGVEAIRTVLKACRDRGVQIVTLFAFSSENWQRPTMEVSALMRLFAHYLEKEVAELHKDGVRVRFIGKRDRFSKALLNQMAAAEALTANNEETTLVIAVDYGGQWDITNAARELSIKVASGQLKPSEVTEAAMAEHMALSDLSPPDLCIRTAGEHRISNFLLWQMAYTELYFSDEWWPDFDAESVDKAIAAFATRERRFGGRNA